MKIHNKNIKAHKIVFHDRFQWCQRCIFHIMHIDFNVKHANIFHKGVEFPNYNLIKKNFTILITYPQPWCFVLIP